MFIQQSLPCSAVSPTFIDMQDVVAGGAGMLHILASIHAERDQTKWPEPGVEYQNKVKILHHVHINVYIINHYRTILISEV